jgi:hypothetical protein
VTAEWRRIQRDHIDEERAEADQTAGPSRRRLPWAGLLAALAAGVVAAILANIVVGTPDRPRGDETSGVGARLGLLARPETSADPLPSADEPAGDAEAPVTGSSPAAAVEVFVPVPKTVVGPPARAAEAAP